MVRRPNSDEEERRRTQRVLLSMRITVEGHVANDDPFCEETRTVDVNVHGALIELAADVKAGQQIVLHNPLTGEKQQCHVVWVGEKNEPKAQVGIEFDRPAPQFWHISFPPADWEQVPD